MSPTLAYRRGFRWSARQACRAAGVVINTLVVLVCVVIWCLLSDRHNCGCSLCMIFIQFDLFWHPQQ